MFKTPKIRNRNHLKFIASLPCIICGAADVQAAHLRSGNSAGMGLKSGDDKTLPLCLFHHAEQHKCGNEAKWWSNHGGYDNANMLALKLYELTGQHTKAQRAIHEHRQKTKP